MGVPAGGLDVAMPRLFGGLFQVFRRRIKQGDEVMPEYVRRDPCRFLL